MTKKCSFTKNFLTQTCYNYYKIMMFVGMFCLAATGQAQNHVVSSDYGLNSVFANENGKAFTNSNAKQSAANVSENLIKNGDFESNSLDHWKTLEDYSPLLLRVVNSNNYKDEHGSGKDWVSPFQSNEHWLKMYANAVSGKNSSLTIAQNIELPAAEPLQLDFDIVIAAPTARNDGSDIPFNVRFNSMDQYESLFRIIPHNKIQLGLAESTWNLKKLVKPGVTIDVKREDEEVQENVSENKYFKQFNNDKKSYRYHITAKISSEVVKNFPKSKKPYIAFGANHFTTYFLDNISLVILPPETEQPVDKIDEDESGNDAKDGYASCPDGFFDLTSAEPEKENREFKWFSDSEGSIPVDNPKKVMAGTYYMQTISTETGLGSEELKAFTVRQNCPTVTGTVYHNYEGVSLDSGDLSTTNGGGLYAHLVDDSNNVISVVAVNEDGTYRLVGEETLDGELLRVIINADSIPVGSSLSKSTLKGDYVHAGDQYGEGSDFPGDGISVGFSLENSEEQGYVDFGIQKRPSVSDITGNDKNPGAGEEFAIPKLESTDDDPDWNGGEGQKLIIESITTTHGKLMYDGEEITGQKTIDKYDPTKLLFVPETNEEASFEFTYKYIDKADAESDVANVRYNFEANTVGINDESASHITWRIYSDARRNVVVTNPESESVKVNIYDVAGRLVAERQVKANATEYISLQSQGVYIVKVANSYMLKTQRVVLK